MDPNFVEKRKEELETFLKGITTHDRLKFDKQLFAFLTIRDFEQYRTNPSAFDRITGIYQKVPSFSDINLTSIKEAITT